MHKNKYWLHYFTVLQVISMAATLYQNLSFGEILGRFGATASVFGFTTAFSVFALAMGLPFGGKLVDKFGGTKTFLLAQKISILANLISLLLYFFNAHLYVWITYQIFYGFISSIEVASRQHFIFENMVNTNSTIKKGLSTVSYDISLNGFAKIIGYSFGAQLLSHANPIWAFVFNAITYLVMTIWIINNLEIKTIVHKISKYNKFPVSTIWNNLHLRQLFLCESIFSFSLYAVNTQAYLLIKTLHSPYHFGWFLMAASTGNFLVNILYTRKHGFHFRFNIVLFSCSALFGLLLLAWHPNFWICLLGVSLTGASLTNFSITTRAHLHETLININKGAVFSLFQVNWNIWTGLGTLFFGAMVEHFGFTVGFFTLFSTIALFLIGFLIYRVRTNDLTELLVLSQGINSTQSSINTIESKIND